MGPLAFFVYLSPGKIFSVKTLPVCPIRIM
jgi:hypothetical protein